MAMNTQQAKIKNRCNNGKGFSTTYFDLSTGNIIPKASSITAAMLAGSITPTLLTTAAKTKQNALFYNGCTSTALTTNTTFGQSIVMPVAGNITAAYFTPTATIAAGTATDNLTINLLNKGTAVGTKVIHATGTCTANTANVVTVTTSAVAALDVMTIQYQKVGTTPADPVSGSLSIVFAPS